MFNYKVIPVAAFASQYCQYEWMDTCLPASRVACQVSVGGDVEGSCEYTE
jgi:hypothetical protein